MMFAALMNALKYKCINGLLTMFSKISTLDVWQGPKDASV